MASKTFRDFLLGFSTCTEVISVAKVPYDVAHVLSPHIHSHLKCDYLGSQESGRADSGAGQGKTTRLSHCVNKGMDVKFRQIRHARATSRGHPTHVASSHHTR